MQKTNRTYRKKKIKIIIVFFRLRVLSSCKFIHVCVGERFEVIMMIDVVFCVLLFYYKYSTQNIQKNRQSTMPKVFKYL